MSMRVVAARHGALRVTERPVPVPGPGQVLVRTLATGICGSDLHALHTVERRAALSERAGYPIFMPPGEDVVFGHEFCAEIVAFGPETERRLGIGTKVISLPFAKGPSGYELVGFSSRFPGGFGEYMILTEALLIEVADGVDPRHASLTEPLAVGLHSVREADIPPDGVCMVLGCGPIGLAIVCALKAAGHGPIIAVDFSRTRREAAKSMGADVLVDPGTTAPHGLWEEFGVKMVRRDPTLPDSDQPDRLKPVIFECVGVPGMLQGLFDSAPPYARLIMVGVCQESDSVDQWIAIQKQLELRYVFGCSRGEFEETYRKIAEGEFDPSPMITAVVPLEQTPDAFERLGTPEKEIKIVVNVSS